jgi:hypothetical protein
MPSRSVFNNAIRGLAFAILAGAGIGSWSAFGQAELPPEVKHLPIWPGAAEAARQFPGTFVFRETTGQIVVSYPDPGNPANRLTTRFWLHNRIDPHILAGVSQERNGTYDYRYTVQNGAGAKTAIWSWSIVGPSSPETSVSHATWQGLNAYQSVTAPQALLPAAGPGSYLGWMDALDKAPIEPGNRQTGFEIKSPLLPGLATAYAMGREDPIRLSENAPDSVDEAITVLERPEILNQACATIGPRFAAATRRSDIARAFRNDIRDLQERGMLARNSVFLHQLGQILEKAEAAGDDSAITVGGIAETELEKELRAAVQLSLAVRR